jgi:fructose-bisphosphate aldolase class II
VRLAIATKDTRLSTLGGKKHRPAALADGADCDENPGRASHNPLKETFMAYAADFERALEVGRPPTITALFPNSRALLVSGKAVDRAMRAKGKAIAMAANGRNSFVIRGALRAAQRANAALIIEIAKSEGGQKAYCAVNYWNMARIVDAFCNELGITIPVAIHADHYGIKNDEDLDQARTEIPTMFEAGITSIAIDASHQPNDQNLLANLAVNEYIPAWAGRETEVGEIKGSSGLSTPDEALFLIKGLNAHGIAADWIALNNGTTHGIEASDAGIQVGLTAEVHKVLEPYEVSGAQHGTSGNSSERLREIAARTHTTKANVATALQMISWGLEVNDYGNAQLDQDGSFIKVPGEGVTEEMWAQVVAYADEKGWKKGDYKNLNLPFESRFLAQPADVRERMARRVEDFAYKMMTEVFNAQDTAPLAVEAILSAGSHDLGPKVGRREDPAEWTAEKIVEKAKDLDSDKGAAGDFDD